MDKLNALFKSHRTRVHGLTVKTSRSSEVDETGHKSAPCTPCLQRDVMLDTCHITDLSSTSPRLAHLECAGSTPRLNRSQNCKVHDMRVGNICHAVDCDCDVDNLTGARRDCFNNDSISGPMMHYCHDADVNGASAMDRSRRRRRQRSREQQRSGHRVVQKCTHVPGGLDKSWEACRIEGLEMLQHSVEQRRERRGHHEPSVLDHHVAVVGAGAQLGISRESRDRSKSRSESNRCQHRTQPVEPVKLPELKVCIERRLVELTRQLAEERQKSRQDRLSLAKLQQELARQKSEHPLREMLIKELERERRMRSELENRLRDKLSDLCDCKPRLLELQMELTKTKEFSHSLLPYKSKFERLKEDHASMTLNFESRLDTLQNEILHLTEENGSLSSELSRMQDTCASGRTCSQPSECRLSLNGTSHSDDNVAGSSSGASDKTKVLLERLKMLETEKTCLVLENEKQCEQYEKCLDDITCQVLQALMSQRSLKEECSKLRGQVCELQQQNDKLCRMLDQQSHMTSSSDTIQNENLMQWRDNQSVSWIASSDLVASLGSLNSMCSDHEQLQYIVGRLSSPTTAPLDMVDVGGDGLSSVVDLTLGGQYNGSEESHDECNCDSLSNTVDPAVATNLRDIDATGSTVSLNELLDSCIFDGENNADVFADPDAAFTDPSGWVAVGDIIGKQWIESLLDKTKSPDHVENNVCENNDVYNAVSGVTKTLPDFLLSIRNCYKRSFTDGIQTHYGSSDLNIPGKIVGHDSGTNGLHQSLMLSNASSSGSTIESSRGVDDGYHSNATSAVSPDVNGCIVVDQAFTAR